MTASTTTRVLDLEARIAQMLMNTGNELVTMQGATQPGEVSEVRSALKDAHEIRIELVYSSHPYMRIVTVDASGNDTHLIRRLEMQLPATVSH